MWVVKNYWVYIMASWSGTLYVGITNNLQRRIFEHKHHLIEGFSKKYSCTRLVYSESFNDVRLAIKREKQIKNWSRKKKEWLIKVNNKSWNDLSVIYQLDQMT